MNILHINSYCSVSKFYKNFFVTQKRNGIDNTAYIPVSFSANTENLDFGENAIISKVFSKADRINFMKKQKRIFADIQKKVNVSEYDLIHAHSLFSNGCVAYMLHKKYGIPFITAVRDTDINFFFKRFVFLRKLGVDILNAAEKVIFISPSYKEKSLIPYVKNYCNSDIFKKSVVIPNGVDDFWINNAACEGIKIDTDEIRVLCVARISKEKNIPLLVKACENIKKRGYSIHLTIIGKVECERDFDKLSKSDIVEYVPHCSKEELINYYRKNNVFALVSHTETFGIVYLEAMSQGLPVIYTRGQGFDGQFPEGVVGYSANQRDVCEVSEKILEAYKNSEKLSQNCIQGINDFKWDCISKKYNDLYKEVLR